MRFKYKCTTCGATGWASGWAESDTNAAWISEEDPMEDACEHIKAGGDYDLIDQEYEEFDDA